MKLIFWRKRIKYKYKVGDVIIYVNIFGVVYRWKLSERTTWTMADGTVTPAYHWHGSDTPWFPLQEKDILRKASRKDMRLSNAELQQKYGFTPTEWYGCW